MPYVATTEAAGGPADRKVLLGFPLPSLGPCWSLLSQRGKGRQAGPAVFVNLPSHVQAGGWAGSRAGGQQKLAKSASPARRP